MARPIKRRNVCSMPMHNMFGPLAGNHNNRETITMSVDEYEVIRLIDLEGLSQEESAEKMDIARTSAQRIYNIGKQKVADALVNGKNLLIEGGTYRLCAEGDNECHGRRGCHRKNIGGFGEHKHRADGSCRNAKQFSTTSKED